MLIKVKGGWKNDLVLFYYQKFVILFFFFEIQYTQQQKTIGALCFVYLLHNKNNKSKNKQRKCRQQQQNLGKTQ